MRSPLGGASTWELSRESARFIGRSAAGDEHLPRKMRVFSAAPERGGHLGDLGADEAGSCRELDELARLEHQRARQRHALLLAPDSCCGLRPARWPSRTLSSAAATRARVCAVSTLRTDSGKATFCATVMCGNSE